MGIAGAVTDEAGRVFPLVNIRYPDNCLVRMLNCRTTDLIDLFDRIPQTAGYVLNFVGEQTDKVTERTAAANQAEERETANAVSKLDSRSLGAESGMKTR